MIFENLAEKLQSTLKNLKGKGKLNEKDIDNAMREVKLALLEADVNYKVVKSFIKKIKERAVGSEVMESLTPGQMVIKIVNDELSDLMGNVQSKLNLSSKPPTVIMLVGLQGAGKTTTVGKLANHLKKQGKQPMTVACDIYRPAAIKQLEIVSEKAGAVFYSEEENKNAVAIAQNGVNKARTLGYDIVLIDTAGRLHVDEELMEELKQIKSTVKPQEILLVVDSMTGQDAVTIAETFDSTLGIDGVVLTKLDGDTRGGAALSIKAITQKPIKFAAVGEKLEDIEPFHPERMASRILGMGDVMSLIEKAQVAFDEKSAQKIQDKIKSADFTFEDFLDQMQMVKKMGPIKNLLEMVPGMSQMKQFKEADIDEREILRVEAIIRSMTIKERQNPSLINASRKKRIAKGSGTEVQQVNRLLKQFEESKKMMKQFSGMGKSMKKGKFKFPFPGL